MRGIDLKGRSRDDGGLTGPLAGFFHNISFAKGSQMVNRQGAALGETCSNGAQDGWRRKGRPPAAQRMSRAQDR